MAQNRLDRQLAAGVRAAQQGNAERARELLEGVLRLDRDNEQAWIWMASVVGTDRERRHCLERVLKINPGNQAAQATLNSMVGVLSDGDSNIDFDAISQAARTPVPSGRSGDSGSSSPAARQAQASGGGGGRRRFLPLLVVVALILSALLIVSIFFPDLLSGVTPEPTDVVAAIEETEEIEATVDPLFTPPSPTIQPTPTFSGTLATSSVNLPPTFTPTPSQIPSETPPPTSTLPSRQDYSFLIIGIQGTARSSMYGLNGDGAGLTPLLSNVSDIAHNPATGRIAFVRPRDGDATQFQLFLSDIDAVDRVIEIQSDLFTSAFSPDISPDGNFVAFTANDGNDNEIYIYDIDNNEVSVVTVNANDNDQDPTWSPDGTQIVFASDRDTPTRNELFIVEAFVEEADITRITNSRGNNIRPEWSPNSDEIAYVNQNSDNTTLRVTDSNGSFARDLTFRPNWTYTAPAWTDDGNYIIYTAGEPDTDRLAIFFVSTVNRDEQSFNVVNLDIRQVVAR